MFIAGIQICALLCLVTGGLFIIKQSYLLYYSYGELQALLRSFEFYNAPLYLFFCGLFLCASSIYMTVDVIYTREVKRYMVMLLLMTAILVELGLKFGFGNSENELDHELPVILRNSLTLAVMERTFDSEEETKAWDHLQMNFECCGVDSAADWTEGVSYPDSCCGGREAECGGCLVPLSHSASIVNFLLRVVHIELAFMVAIVGITAYFPCDRKPNYRKF